MKMNENIIKYYRCLLLHKKTNFWDGSYILDEENKEYIPKIKHLCQECQNENDKWEENI